MVKFYPHGIFAIVRSILYPESHTLFVCDNKNEAKNMMDSFKRTFETHKIIEPEIDKDIADTYISFKNGSCIEVLDRNNKKDTGNSRGKRADFKHWMFDYEGCLDMKTVDEVLKPFMVEKEK